MPLQLPNLDDRTYDDLVQEALSLIPSYAPEWTNYNASDPGITLIELFAYLSEMLIYRLNRVRNANRQAFLNLIVGLDDKGQKRYPAPLDEATLNQEIQKAVLQLRQSDRAITRADFERHAVAIQQVARAHCIPLRNLATSDMQSGDLPGHISVVIVPTLPADTAFTPTALQPTADMIQVVSNDLEQRRLLTTRVHVVGAKFVSIGIQLEIHLKPDALETTVQSLVETTLKEFLHPLRGGTDGIGWEFGRSVFVSEIYELLDQLPGIEFIVPDNDQPELHLVNSQNFAFTSGDRLLKTDRGDLIGIQLFANELVHLSQIQLNFPTFN